MVHELVLVEGPVTRTGLRDEGVLDAGGPEEVLGPATWERVRQ
jgi:hypothetical protein